MNVCSECFNDEELQGFIESNSTGKGICDFCKTEASYIDTNELLDFFVEFLDSFSEDENGKPLIDLIDNDWGLFANEDKGEGVLIELLKETNLSIKVPGQKVVYGEDIVKCTDFWHVLKNELKWERRFLTDVKVFEEFGWDRFFAKNNIHPTEQSLYRARIHPNDTQRAYGISEMGSPEPKIATAGRANPQGIPYLYLSKSIGTTFYETRATYLDEVSIGEFVVKKDEVISLVDFTEKISLFMNIGDINNYVKSVILKKYISVDLSKPLRRYDSDLEYIPTQFICEFIKNLSNADDIMFNSSLHIDGKNVVLFNESKMECVEVLTYRVTEVNISHELI